MSKPPTGYPINITTSPDLNTEAFQQCPPRLTTDDDPDGGDHPPSRHQTLTGTYPRCDCHTSAQASPRRHKVDFALELKTIPFSSWFTILLLPIPISWALHFTECHEYVLVFISLFLAIIPLAKLLSFVTCALKKYTESSANIYSMEVTSDEYLSEVRSLLNCPSKITRVRNLRGDEAQMFIDSLDRVLARSCLDDKHRQRSLRLLSKICRARRILPSSYILQQDLIQVGPFYCDSGCAVVNNGEYSECPVAIKRLKMTEEDSDGTFKGLCREIISWKHLSHPNILPLLGVSMSADLRCLRILTEWMSNGNVMQYSESNPKENRLRLLSEIMSGAAYIHDLGIVHGDLKGANILIDGTGAARVADFGFMTMIDLSTMLLSETTVSPGGTIRWMSPELLDPTHFGSNGRPTRESDCYALGMVVYEVLTGLLPFHRLRAFAPATAVLKGRRPDKPVDAKSLGFSDALWGLVRSCWSESISDRPTARQLLDCLSLDSLDWVPPRVYPIIVTDTSSITDSDSSS